MLHVGDIQAVASDLAAVEVDFQVRLAHDAVGEHSRRSNTLSLQFFAFEQPFDFDAKFFAFSVL